MQIWKYPVAITDRQSIEMPQGAALLAFKEQYGQPTLWALVDPDAPREERNFCVVGTGNEMPDDTLHYIDTMIQSGMPLVWHLFESV